MNRTRRDARSGRWIGLFLCAFLGLPLAVRAQDEPQDTQDGGYSVSENRPSDTPVQQESNAGPVRMARFSIVEGSVTWRADSSLEWSDASVNLPLRQGAQVYVPDHARAEIQFDDGSLLRLGAGATITLQTLYSDADGEFTALRLTDGLASLSLRHKLSVYQMDTPYVSIKATGPAKLRVGVGESVEVAVRSGKASIEGRQGEVTLNRGDYLDLRDANASFDVSRLPHADNWDRWNEDRDRLIEDEARPVKKNCPPNVAIAAPELDDYGTWRDDPQYGHVWCPRVTVNDWRPYHYGHWVWVSPFGWTWVSSEPWGWAPYHYGSWAHTAWGWAWVPGPVNQYWSPAVVHFCEDNGSVAWVPLAPREVYYPSSLNVTFHSGNWCTSFSIGAAAVYYPYGGHIWRPRPWHTTYVNNVTNITNITNINGTTYNRFANSREFRGGVADLGAMNRNAILHSMDYIPQNARLASGVTMTEARSFGGRGDYRAVSRSEASLFTRGQNVGAPGVGALPAAGPPMVKPTLGALTPGRVFSRDRQPAESVMDRAVYRAPLPGRVTRSRPTEPLTNSPSNSENRITIPENRGGVSERTRQPQTGSPSVIPDRRVTVDGTRQERVIPGSREGNGQTRARTDTSRPGFDPNRQSSEMETIIRARQSVGLPGRVRPNTERGTGAANSGSRDTPNTRPDRTSGMNGTETHGRTPSDTTGARGRYENSNEGAVRRGQSPADTPRTTMPTTGSRERTRTNDDVYRGSRQSDESRMPGSRTSPPSDNTPRTRNPYSGGSDRSREYREPPYRRESAPPASSRSQERSSRPSYNPGASMSRPSNSGRAPSSGASSSSGSSRSDRSKKP